MRVAKKSMQNNQFSSQINKDLCEKGIVDYIRGEGWGFNTFALENDSSPPEKKLFKNILNPDGWVGDLFIPRSNLAESPRFRFYQNFHGLMRDRFGKTHEYLIETRHKKDGVEYWYSMDLWFKFGPADVFCEEKVQSFVKYLVDSKKLPMYHSRLVTRQDGKLLFGDRQEYILSRIGSWFLLTELNEYLPHEKHLKRDMFCPEHRRASDVSMMVMDAVMQYAILFFMLPNKSRYSIADYVYNNMRVRLYKTFCAKLSKLSALVKKFPDYRATDFSLIREKMLASVFGDKLAHGEREVREYAGEKATKEYKIIRYFRLEYMFLLILHIDQVAKLVAEDFDDYEKRLAGYNNKEFIYFPDADLTKKADAPKSAKAAPGRPQIPSIRKLYEFIWTQGRLLRDEIADVTKADAQKLTERFNGDLVFTMSSMPQIVQANKWLRSNFVKEATPALTLEDLIDKSKELRRFREAFRSNLHKLEM